MSKAIEIATGIVLLLSTLIGSTVLIETRYAKAVDVQKEINSMYAKTLKTKILELQLKPEKDFTAADKALLDHLQQELREVTE